MRETLEKIFTRSQRTFSISPADFIQFGLCALIILLHLPLLIGNYPQRFERSFLDLFLKYRPAAPVSREIVLVNIDDESIEAIGRWPWPWRYHAEMIDLLRDWGAAAVLLDIPFKEEEAPSDDVSLQSAVKTNGRVYLPVYLEAKAEKKFWVHSMPLVVGSQTSGKAWAHSLRSVEKFAKALGHGNAETDADGILRRISPALSHGEETYPHIALKAAYDFMGLEINDAGLTALPLDRNQNLIINWAGEYKTTFSHFSYSDLIRSFQAEKSGRSPLVASSEIKNKICIVGPSAGDIANFKVSPLGESVPSAGIHAQVINSVLTGRMVVPVAAKWNALVMTVIGVMVSFLFAKIRSIVAFLLGLLLAVIWILFAFLLFCHFGLLFFISGPLFIIPSLFIFTVLFGYFMSGRERARLFNLATRDGLTGLYIIRYFREVLNQVVKNAEKTKEEVSLLLMDIDNFKPINDTYGHPAGDMVLKKVAGIVTSVLKTKRPIHAVDLAARYGGEELIVMMRHTVLQDAAETAEAIRQSIESGHYEWDEKKIKVTVSIGVSERCREENIPDPMVRRADEALYQAKRSGKNRVCQQEKRNEKS